MKNSIYNVEKTNKILNKAVGCYCPHCGELSYNFPLERHSLFREPVPQRQCDLCRKTAYGKLYLFILHLVSLALIPLVVLLWLNFESNIPAMIGVAGFIVLNIVIAVLSLLDHPRTYYTTRMNRYEFGDRIYIKPIDTFPRNRFFRAGQIYEIRSSNISDEWVAIGQADSVSANCIVLRIIKNEDAQLCLNQSVCIEPKVGSKVYGVICDEKNSTLHHR